MKQTNGRKRFIAPVFAPKNTSMYFLGMLVVSSWFVFDIYTVWVFKKVGDFVEAGTYKPIQSLTMLYVLVFIVFYIWKYLVRKEHIATSRYEFAKYFRRIYIKKYFGLDYTYVEKFGTGRIINILQEGINSWINSLCDLQVQIPNILIKLGFTLYLLYHIGWQYFLLFLVVFLVLQKFTLWVNQRYTSPLRHERKHFGVQASRQFVRVLMSKQEVVQANTMEYEIDKYASLITQQQHINYRITKFIYVMFNVPIIAAQSIGICIMVYAYMSLANGTFSLGLFSALLGMSGYLTQLMLTATDKFKQISDQYIHVEKMRSLFDEAPINKDLTQGDDFEYKQGDITLRNLSFSYPEGADVFKEFSLSIRGGEKTALVGMSGSGKSTLVKLIAGYIVPDHGAVFVDGQDLSMSALSTYYPHIGYLTQEPSVFDGTIKENLIYSLHHAGLRDDEIDARIHKALDSAECSFVYDFPDGINTEIGERGVKLSGGQRQRLAIAKIFLKDPQILILDEPTSALDSFSEESITNAMHELFAGRTVIIIAHRLQTVKEADRIVVLGYDESTQSSVVLEEGTHDGLTKAGGFYATMLEVQTGF